MGSELPCTPLLPGRATRAGTRRFADRAIEAGAHPDHFSKPDNLWLSSLALGTRGGRPGAADDLLYRDAVATCLELGCNVIDTALSDRIQTSERAVGAALRRAIETEGYARDEIVIISKGGYLVAEPDLVQGSESARRYLTKTYIETGLVDRARLSNGSSLDATFMLDQLQRSRTNLGLETIDFFLVQEPELHLRACGPDEFQRRLTLLFQALEGAARSGQIGAYGICSWDGFLVPYSERGHLSLVEIFAAALAAGSADHHLRAIQLPYGLARVDAAALLSQLSPHAQSSPLIEMLPNSGTVVLASAPLQGGRILGRVPDSLREAYPEAQSDAQCCLQFVRSTSGIDCAVVGMREPPHLADNLALARCAPAKPALAAELIARSVSPA